MKLTYTHTILLSFFIQSSMLCTVRASTINKSATVHKSVDMVRPCRLYERCRNIPDSGPSILQAQSILRYGTNLTSDGSSYTVGFFGLGNNTYLGTWYGNFSKEPVIVWVANRNKPIPSQLQHRFSLALGKDGNAAVVMDWDARHTYWSTHYDVNPSNGSNTQLQILSSGNLVLWEKGTPETNYLWQSFENPTDTFLAGMHLGNLTSWKTPEDPFEGDYVLKRGEGDRPIDLLMYTSSQSSTPYWDSSVSGGLPPNLISLLYNNLTGNSTLRLVMNSTRSVQLWELDQDGESWSMTWAAPKDQCDLYDPCGSFGVCDAGNGFRCKCLPGYQPSDPVKWESKDFSSGCSKKTNDPCGDMFLRLPMVKLPPNTNTESNANNETDCKDTCLSGCGKLAYSFDHSQSRCLIWTEGLSTIEEEYYSADAITLNIRLNHSDLGHHKHTSLWIEVGIASGIVLFLLCGIALLVHFQRRATNTTGTVVQFKADDIEEIDIPFVDYQSIVVATDNFSVANKLGAGGFGPVYKGVLADGNEVAVKRLSATSVQGAQEFRNEIIVIAKLQHRNLVRILGYCISEDEKILIYEYMPNKSLDSSLFDPSVSPSLDWMKRTNIILGIARGLLYLHEDSRLRIIHRDLKPSNILLDEGLNPKISDFGLAKIVAGNDMATNTARVVGTHGYMSPEYALEGYFSTKSDVYSFGIIVFEVISGKRCTSLLPLENELANLLGYAWDLWKQGKELELVDKSIIETCDDLQFKRFINVALLCVQENPSDRPTMSSALLMLSSDNMNLPCPKQPVFIARRQASSSSKFGSSAGSRVDLTTTTTLEAR